MLLYIYAKELPSRSVAVKRSEVNRLINLSIIADKYCLEKLADSAGERLDEVLR
jgi:hypothetical protein